MLKTIVPATALAAVLMTQGAIAATDTSAMAPGSGQGLFIGGQDIQQWRAPKLVGVAVYDNANHKVGSIKDLLVDHNGATQTVVIGVGGFLGIGTKDVGVPFSAVQWQTEPRQVAEPVAQPSQPPNATSAAAPTMKTEDPATTEATQGYPDKAVLQVTMDQLKTAPDFKYTPNSTSAATTRPDTTGQAKQTP